MPKVISNEKVADNFAVMQTGANKMAKFRSELNRGQIEAYSYEMRIAFWYGDKVYMPLVDSRIENLDASMKTKDHMAEIESRLRNDNRIVYFIPETDGTYYNGSDDRAPFGGSGDRDYKYLVEPRNEGFHCSKKIWKTERGAFQNAVRVVDYYKHYINFRGVDVYQSDLGDWHWILQYSDLKLFEE